MNDSEAKITWEDVVLYLEGDIVDATEVARIEWARDNDPNVAALFAQVVEEFSPSEEAMSTVRELFRTIRESGSTTTRARTDVQAKQESSLFGELLSVLGSWTPGKPARVSRSAEAVWQRQEPLAWFAAGALHGATDADATTSRDVNAEEPVELRDGRVFIQVSAQEAEFGVARLMVFRREHGGSGESVLLGTCLVPLARTNGSRSASEPIASWIADFPVSDIRCEVVPARRGDAENLRLFPAAELSSLKEDPRVERNVDLGQDLDRLLQLVNE